MTQSVDVLVVGGGPAGAAAAARLAAAGLQVVLCERQAQPRPQVCGEYVSAAAAAELTQLGLAPGSLGGCPLSHARIWGQGSAAAARMPVAGYGLSRARLDRSLLAQAARCGADVRSGVAVRLVEPARGNWIATLGDGNQIESAAVVLATGKHDLRGHCRPWRGARPFIGFKMHCRLHADQAAALGDAVELFLYDSGYAGLQPIETDAANLCFITTAACLRGGNAWTAALRHLRGVAPTLELRLRAACMLWPRPASVARIPYGYLCADHAVPDGLYRVGDQAAVIPSFTGEGIAIALRSARLAATAVLAGDGAERYADALRRDLQGPLRRSGLVAAAIRRRPLRGLGLRLASLPGVPSVLPRLGRLDPYPCPRVAMPLVLPAVESRSVPQSAGTDPGAVVP
jgi:flavin-dependent dehydrogenase